MLVSAWLHEPAIIPVTNILHVNAALQYSPVLIQAYGVHHPAVTCVTPFPFRPDTPSKGQGESPTVNLKWKKHPAVVNLSECMDLEHNCGYLMFANIGVPDFGNPNRNTIVKLGRVHKNINPGKSVFER